LTTRTFVLDASAAVEIASSAAGFAKLADLRLIAPPLFWSETLSALHQAVRRGVTSPELAEHALRALEGSRVVRTEHDALRADAWQLATQLGWAKTYDAEYVALARHFGVPLLTRDGALARGVGDLVEIVDLFAI
jgi:predicted nucleic acid-binding protein